MNVPLKQLNKFLGRAAAACYAGSGNEVRPQRPGFKEFNYSVGLLRYRDSYAGYFSSAGQEVVWYRGKPIWTQSYCGGMGPRYRDDEEFAHHTFDFLKCALSHGVKYRRFQPRGPRSFSDRYWRYYSAWKGDIERFEGHERIMYRGRLVFTHGFFGGRIIGRDKQQQARLTSHESKVR